MRSVLSHIVTRSDVRNTVQERALKVTGLRIPAALIMYLYLCDLYLMLLELRITKTLVDRFVAR